MLVALSKHNVTATNLIKPCMNMQKTRTDCFAGEMEDVSAIAILSSCRFIVVIPGLRDGSKKRQKSRSRQQRLTRLRWPAFARILWRVALALGPETTFKTLHS